MYLIRAETAVFAQNPESHTYIEEVENDQE
jgi:hypothetical protein